MSTNSDISHLDPLETHSENDPKSEFDELVD